jgi:hypothetical protein
MKNEDFGRKIWKEREKHLTLYAEIVFIMSNTRTITIKNPSRKLEERIRKIGVQKYLWIEKLCSDETKPTKTIYV